MCIRDRLEDLVQRPLATLPAAAGSPGPSAARGAAARASMGSSPFGASGPPSADADAGTAPAPRPLAASAPSRAAFDAARQTAAASRAAAASTRHLGSMRDVASMRDLASMRDVVRPRDAEARAGLAASTASRDTAAARATPLESRLAPAARDAAPPVLTSSAP